MPSVRLTLTCATPCETASVLISLGVRQRAPDCHANLSGGEVTAQAPFRAASDSAHLDRLLDAKDESLLLLFFRKEVLSCLFSFYLDSYQIGKIRLDGASARAGWADSAGELPLNLDTGALASVAGGIRTA